jgi:hypothetical protein
MGSVILSGTEVILVAKQVLLGPVQYNLTLIILLHIFYIQYAHATGGGEISHK